MKEEMKDSGIEWIGLIPREWGTVRMQDIAEYKKGPFGSAITIDMFVDKGENTYKVYEQKNAIQADETLGWYYIERNDYLNLKEFSLKPGDIIVSCAGTIGKCFVLPENIEEGIINQALMRVRTYSNIDKSFFIYLFAVALEYMNEKFSNGSAIKNIPPFSVLKKQKIAVPTKIEQKLIANFLDERCMEIDDIIIDLENQIERLNKYKISLIHETVTKGLEKNCEMKKSGVDWIGDIPNGWKLNKVKYLATEDDTLFVDGDWIESDNIEDVGIRYLTTGNVGPGYYKEQGDGFISEETFKKLHCLKVLPGDLMISRLNEPIGRTCIVPNTYDHYVVAVDNVILRPDSNIHKNYMMYVMNSDGYTNWANIVARGSTMSRISRSQLGQFWVPVPSLEEQIKIADYLDEKVTVINEIIDKKQLQLEKIKSNKSSLIYEYVTGKKRVKVGE